MDIPYLRTKFLLFLFIVPFSVLFVNFDVVDNISSALSRGDSRELARYFDSNVEITILDKESMYSKVQAEMVLRDFFAKNSVRSFDALHKGTSGEGSMYCIGNLKTQNQVYRTYFYVKQKGNSIFIQEMRFEKQR